MEPQTLNPGNQHTELSDPGLFSTLSEFPNRDCQHVMLNPGIVGCGLDWATIRHEASFFFFFLTRDIKSISSLLKARCDKKNTRAELNLEPG